MPSPLKVYNTLSGQIENFNPINPPFVGLYLCGPTVYGYPHLGHTRGPIVFDIIHRYLSYLGYKVRFVRNITDVGHLVNDADEGEDKIAKRAKIEQLEPMEIAQHYTDSYHFCIDKLNVKRPSIEPRASGHIIEQIEMIKQIIENGFAYEANGSVYFDVLKYAETNDYGKLSGRILEDLMAGAGEARRELEGQEEKKNPNDFALWKKASEEHIMQWPSPWGQGFPGWHIECSAMSAKYLGKIFDIHGGGMDLLFPHHESEIAQSTACNHANPAKYWIHHNMVTINGQKMAKSLNNGILITELFEGNHPLLEQAYSPMTLKFFILQAHYRGTLDFGNEALKAAEKGLQRLMNAMALLQTLKPGATSDFEVTTLKENILEALNDDFNTPIAIAQLFEAASWINKVNDGNASITATDLENLKSFINTIVFDVLGLMDEQKEMGTNLVVNRLADTLLDIRDQVKARNDYEIADEIRDKLEFAGFKINDGKEETKYVYNNILGFRDFTILNEIKEYISGKFNIYKDENIFNGKELKIYDTEKQKTWIIVTEKNLFCIMDDIEINTFKVRFHIKKDEVTNQKFELKIKTDFKEKTGLIDFGNNHKGWRYSKELFIRVNIVALIKEIISQKMQTNIN